jgi:hypothetical protein
MKLSPALLFILLMTTASISNSQDNNNSPDNNDNLLHVESSERLKTIMQRLFSLIHDEGIEEPTKLTQNDMTDLIETVEELLFYAELMSAKIPATELEENESVIFSAMAGQLYNEALNIQQLATNYDLHVIDNAQDHILNEAFERLNRTCAACHQLFRAQ